ncbi:MAG: InlB B-repeat-containing protein [Bacilli bacterium]|nr:InlB B-repeat-containing protein [Bacilli bacterium]
MKNKLLLIFSLLLVLPLTVMAAGEANVTSLDTHAEDGGNIILFGGTTENSSHAVMCKLYDNQDEEIDKLSVEVTNEGTNGTFGGSFLAPSVGTYTVSCANYEGGNIVSDDVSVTEMTKVSVTFYDPIDDIEISSVEVDAGQVVARPNPDPAKNGKVFAGWYEDSTYTTPFDFSTRITAFVTIYAKWNDEEVTPQNQTRVQVIYSGGGTYQVDFNTDDPDNQGPMHAQIDHSANYFVDPNTEVTLTAYPAQGHHLAGWYATHEEEDSNNLGHMIWVEDELLSNQTEYVFTPEGENVNIKLVFEEDTVQNHTVTFDTDGGTIINPIVVEHGHTVARPSQDPAKDNKVFGGWFADHTKTTEFDFNTPITSDTTIYAKWDDPVIKHTVTFNTNGGSAIEPVLVVDGQTVNKPTNPTKNGKVFGGWYEDDNLENEYNFSNPIMTNTTIYAKWLQEYNTDDEEHNNSITFVGEENKTGLHLVITDLSNLPDEALAQMDPPMTREEYEGLKDIIINAAKQYGTLISFLDISVLDNNNEPVEVNNGATISLNYTDEMGEYKSYKLVYIDTDANNNIVLGQSYNLSKQGNKLVGNLDHLSGYALVGSNEDNSTTNGSSTSNSAGKGESTNSSSNPKTSDNIYIWFITLGISLIVLLIGTIKALKLKK